MRTKRRRTDRQVRRICFLIALAIAFGVGVSVLDARLRPGLDAVCEATVRQDVTAIMANAMANTMTDSPNAYSVLLKDENGEPRGVEVLTKQINHFQVQLTDCMNTSLQDYTSHSVPVCLGDASHVALLAGHGPDLRVRLHPAGDVAVLIKSEFSDAGMNQTCHRLWVELTVTVRMAAPLHSQVVTVTSDYLLCETIIVGNLPSGIWSTPQ